MGVATQALLNVGQEAAGIGMGLLLEGHNDRRQLKQQGKLQQLQIQGQKEMSDYNYAKQLQMWKDTNYKAQMEQMKSAGINPGLMYGMSGGGGTTTGSGGGTVQGATAPTGGGEAITGAGMGMQMAAQLALLQAQKENIEADTANKQAETTNKPLQGENIKADTANKLQLTKNATVEEAQQKLELNIQGATMKERIESIALNTEIMQETLDREARNNVTAKATQGAQIDIIRRAAVQALLDQALTKAQTSKIGQEEKTEFQRTDLTRWAIKKMASDIMNGWDSLSVESRKARVQEVMSDYNTTVPAEAKELLDVITEAVDGIFRRTSGGTPRKIGFK